MWETDQFEWAVPITNSGRQPKSVTRWATSCDCLGVTPGSETFAPGETRRVTVRLDLGSKVEKRLGGDSTPVAVALSPVVAGEEPRSPLSQPTWTVKGRVKPILKAVPDVSLGSVSELSQPFPPRSVLVAFTTACRELKASCDSPQLSVRLLGADRPAEQATIEIRLAAAVSQGTYPYTIELRGEVGAEHQPFTKRLVGRVSVVADVQTIPARLSLTKNRDGSWPEEVIRFHSVSGRNVRVVSVTPSPPCDQLTARVVSDSEIAIRAREGAGSRGKVVPLVARVRTGPDDVETEVALEVTFAE